jgi:hypothetical protein
MLTLRGVHAGYGGGDVLRGWTWTSRGLDRCWSGRTAKAESCSVVSGLLPGGGVLFDGSPIERLDSAGISRWGSPVPGPARCSAG